MIKKGDMAHLPSGVMLTKVGDSNVPHACTIVERPSSVLVIENKDGMSKVFINGEIWSVDERYLYEIGSTVL